jgi:predicted nucleic acid-binding protein
VDSNVLLDVTTSDPAWGEWSEAQLATAARRGPVALNPIVYAELAAGFTTAAEVEGVFPASLLARLDLPFAAAWLAGRAHLRYRRAGGVRRSPLPDFYIGAHAQVAGMALLTRDASRYRTYFPGVELIAPDG